MIHHDEDRDPTPGEIAWGYVLLLVLLLYVVIVVLRPVYDYLATL